MLSTTVENVQYNMSALEIDFDVKLPRTIILIPESIYLITIKLTDKREQPRT